MFSCASTTSVPSGRADDARCSPRNSLHQNTELIFPDGQYRAPKLKAGIKGLDRFAAAVAALDAGFGLAMLSTIPGISVETPGKNALPAHFLDQCAKWRDN